MIEFEKRALIDQAQYTTLPSRLMNLGAIDKGDNATSSTFYVSASSQVKVQLNTSQATAKIAWKSGGINGAESRREIELPIAVDQVDNANDLIAAFMPTSQPIETYQKRHDYTLDGIDVAVKYSDDWGFHVEFDITVDDNHESMDIECIARIEALAKKLDIALLTPDQEKYFVEQKLKARLAI